MATDATILHFGADGCNRIAVLRMAGYQVRDCDSLPSLLSALDDGHQPDALLVTEELGDPGREVLHIVRRHSAAPLILFQSPDCQCNESQFDLVIPVLSPPRLWLQDIASLIERSREIRSASQSLQLQSEQLRRESASARERSARLRRKAEETQRLQTSGERREAE